MIRLRCSYKAKETGIDPVREELYGQCFDEVIRQVTINCAERGKLLLDIRNEVKRTIEAYKANGMPSFIFVECFVQALYESGVAYGMRKMLLTEALQSNNKQISKKLENENAALQKQVLFQINFMRRLLF